MHQIAQIFQKIPAGYHHRTLKTGEGQEALPSARVHRPTFPEILQPLLYCSCEEALNEGFRQSGSPL